jgi:hypothetical protein
LPGVWRVLVSCEGVEDLGGLGVSRCGLYLAHAVRPKCPWLEIASERPQAFKDLVQGKLLDPPASSLHADVAYVFLGGSASETGIEEDQWSKAAANLTLFLRTFARRWLHDVNAYNSLKHGARGDTERDQHGVLRTRRQRRTPADKPPKPSSASTASAVATGRPGRPWLALALRRGPPRCSK